MSTGPLELSTIAPERDKARLRTEKNPEGLRDDGSEYELTNPEDLSVIQLQEMFQNAAAMQALWSGEKIDQTEQKRLERVVNQYVQLLIRGASPEDVKALPGVTKQSLVLRFLGQLNQSINLPETMTATAPNGKGSAA